MGIHDFNSTLKDIEKEVIKVLLSQNIQTPYIAFQTGIPLRNFTGQKIAFDAAIVLNAKIQSSHTELVQSSVDVLNPYERKTLQDRTMRKVLGFFASIMSEGITPVVVFDGKPHPYKLEELRKRAASKKKKGGKLDELIEIYMTISPLDRTQEMEDEIRKANKHHVRILPDDYKLMESILTNLGIVCLKAQHDGEKLCSALNKEGNVAAVYSTDTDCIPFGANYLITEIRWDFRSNCNVCNLTSTQHIFYLLTCHFGYQATFEHLIDLCIILGCDFNERMVIPKKKVDIEDPYKSCGAKTGLDLIKTHKRFEFFPANLYMLMEPLNILKCREIFQYEPTGLTEEDTNMDFGLFSRNIREVLTYYPPEKYAVAQFSNINSSSLRTKKLSTHA